MAWIFYTIVRCCLYSLLRISFQRAIRFRVDFLLNFLEGGSFWLINYVFFSAGNHLLSANASSSSYNMTLVYYFQIFIGLFYGAFIDNITDLKYYVSRGDLDWMLLKPVDSQFYISFRFISFGHIVSGLVAVPVLLRAVQQAGGALSCTNLLIGGIYLLLSLCNAYSVLTIVTSLAIALTASGNVSGVVMPMIDLAKYPRQMYPRKAFALLTAIVPVIGTCNLGNAALMGKWDRGTLASSTLIAVFLLFATHFVFHKLCIYYKSSGS